MLGTRGESIYIIYIFFLNIYILYIYILLYICINMCDIYYTSKKSVMYKCNMYSVYIYIYKKFFDWMSIWFTTICLANKHLHIQDLTYCSACLLIESIIGPTIPSCSFQRSRSKQFVISGRREQIPKIPYLPKNLKKLLVFSCVYVFFPNIRRRGYTSLPTWALPRHRPPTSFALDAKEMAKDLADVPGSSLSWLQLASRTMTFNGCVFQRGKKQSEMKPMGSSHQIESNRGFHLYIPFDPFWERLQLETCSGMPIGPSLGLSLIWRETPKYTCSSFTIWCLVIFRNEMGNIYIYPIIWWFSLLFPIKMDDVLSSAKTPICLRRIGTPHVLQISSWQAARDWRCRLKEI